MNNMNNPADYYNYMNNNYNQPVYDQMPANVKLYEPYEGFIRGNMFPTLYNGYKLATPKPIEPLNRQAEMLTHLDALGFAMIDLNLYLIMNTEDRNMITLYNQYRMEKERVLEAYEREFGPITMNSEALNAVPWAWNNSPWPWEVSK